MQWQIAASMSGSRVSAYQAVEPGERIAEQGEPAAEALTAVAGGEIDQLQGPAERAMASPPFGEAVAGPVDEHRAPAVAVKAGGKWREAPGVIAEAVVDDQHRAAWPGVVDLEVDF